MDKLEETGSSQSAGNETSTVETVRGPIDSCELGATLMHEHIFIVTAEIQRSYPLAWWDEDVEVERAVTQLRRVKEVGVDTIVDLTVPGLGRYLPLVERVGRQVDVNIIAATGYYSFGWLPSYFQQHGPGTMLGGPDGLAEMFLRDIREGIDGTSVRAGVLKCVIEESGLTRDQMRVQAAVCEAHQETGTPITVHTNSSYETGRLAVDYYRSHGVDLTKVVIGHAGDSNNLDYLRWIMDQGATIGCDRFGMDMFNSTANRVSAIASLCAEGYADRIVLSHDAGCFADSLSDPYSRERLAEVAPNWNHLHIHTEVLPALRLRGVDEQQISQMLVENPRRYFSRGPSQLARG